MLTLFVLATLAAQAPDDTLVVEVGGGASGTSHGTSLTYEIFVGGGPHAFVRATLGSWSLSSAVDVAATPSSIYTGPTGPFLVDESVLNGSAAVTTLLGHRVDASDAWAFRFAGGAELVYMQEASSDYVGAGFFLLPAASAAAIARVADRVALEATLTVAAGPQPSGGSVFWVARSSLSLSVVWSFGAS